MRKIFLLIILAFCLLVKDLNLAANPENDSSSGTKFIPPLNIPLYLTGTFGELRPGHFHAGIDFKTQEEIGKPVFSIEEGYVARVKVQENGYGKALYINHPGGITSVYAHLDKFMDDIAAYVKEKQYEHQTFEIDLFPDADRFVLNKSDIIGLSGNTGGSLGPHLHFELRETSSEKPMDPMKYYKDFKDNIKPGIRNIAFYPASKHSLVNHRNDKLIITPAYHEGEFHIEDTILVSGKFGIGVETYDYMNETNNRYGVKSVKLFSDSALHFHQQMEKFSFYETRYINSLVDYEEKVKQNLNIQKLFIEPNNKLSTYRYTNNNGYLVYNDHRLHKIRIEINDFLSNQTFIELNIKNAAHHPQQKNQKQVAGDHIMPYQVSNSFKNPFVEVYFPAGCFYDTLHFDYEVKEMPSTGSYASPVHQIHNPYTPVHKSYELKIKPENLPEYLYPKTFIAYINGEDDNPYEYAGSETADGFLKANPRKLGEFALIVDTISPEIRPLNIFHDQDMSQEDSIRLRITDELSGISSYEGRIDGEWVLFEYDKKNDLLFYAFDENRLQMNKEHELVLKVSDQVDNTSAFSIKFFK
mgnify:CR=1 FL=1